MIGFKVNWVCLFNTTVLQIHIFEIIEIYEKYYDNEY